MKSDQDTVIDQKTGEEKLVNCIIFKISKENDQDVDKTFTVYSKRLIKELKPITSKGLPISVTITKYGEGFNTEYNVVEEQTVK